MNRADLVEAFAGFPGQLADAVRAAPDLPVAPGEWGPAEVVRHLIAVEHLVWQARLAQLAAEDHPNWTWMEPVLADGFDEVPLDKIVTAFADARAETVAIIRAIDEAGWARSGTHATFGVLDVAGLLLVAIDHDQEHGRSVSAS